MRIVLRILLAAVVALGLVLGTAYWVTGTQSGTNWLLAQATARAPEGLSVGHARGTLLRGIEVASLEWRSDGMELRARDVAIDIELLPIFDRHLVVETLGAGSVELLIMQLSLIHISEPTRRH